MNPFVQMLLTIIITLVGSSGFWMFVQNRRDKKSATSQMILGLGHDKIIELGEKYVERGWVTMDEYENLSKYLYKPYKQMGGNGAAERIMNEVDQLPIKPNRV